MSAPPSQPSPCGAVRSGADILPRSPGGGRPIAAISAVRQRSLDPALRRAFDAADRLRRRPWLLVGVAALLVAYLAVWYRGPYSGDWSDRWVGVDLVSGRSLSWFDRATIPTYPARILAWKACVLGSRLVADHELAARCLGAAVVGLNGLLLGRLVWRLSASVAAAAVAGLLLTVPVMSPQIVTNADLLNELLGVSFALAYLLAAWRVLTVDRRRWLWLALALVDAAAMLNLFEQAFSVVLLVPVCLLPVAWSRDRARWAALLAWAAGTTGGAVLIGLLYYEFQYRDSPLLAGRGSVDLSPAGLASRSRVIFRAAQWLTVSPDWGLAVLRRSLSLGGAELSSWAAATLFGGLVAAVAAAVVLASRRPPGAGRAGTTSWIVPVALAGGGLLIIPATLLLPGAVVTDFAMDDRFLYLPWAGMALVAGAVVAALDGRVRRPGLRPASVALLGAAVAAGAVGLMGWSRAYADRAVVDRGQLAALTAAVPSSAIPSGAWMVPVATETDADNTDPIRLATLGVLEIPWSAKFAVASTYRRTDITVLTMNRFAGLLVHDRGGGTLVVQGVDVDAARMLAFTYRHGRLAVIDELHIVEPDGVHVVVLPVGRRLADGGVASTAIGLGDGEPLYSLPPG